MALSNDLISQFVKITNDKKEPDKESIVYGEVKQVEYDEGGNIAQAFVLLDGATEQTPMSSATSVIVGDRVVAMIKNHSAVITGNITSHASNRFVYVKEKEIISLEKVINDFDTLVADKVSTEELYAVQGKVETLEGDLADFQEVTTKNFEAVNARIDELDVENLSAQYATIESLETTNAAIENLAASKASIDTVNAANARVGTLEADYGAFKRTTTNSLEAINANITSLQTDKLSTAEAEIKYANINFSNITKAAIEYFYATSGLIEDLVVGEGIIAGKLVGVTISGDLIEGNTVKAEKLVVKGTDGLYYKLNIDAGATTSEEVSVEDLQNGLHGSAIIAKTITAEKISVDDLVAFDATIGGFNIADNVLYSGVKSSVDNTTRGIYLDSTGQMAIGDANNFIKYYKDASGNYKLEISAASIIFSSSKKSVEQTVNDIQEEVDKTQTTANEANTKAANAATLLAQLSDSISTLVTDGNGTSLMTQTEDGWTFSTADIQALVNKTSENLSSLTEEVGNTNQTVDILQQTVNDLGVIAEYVKITTYENEPCIELGEGDSDFKLRITNTRMMFTEGSSVLAYFNNKSLHIKKAVVEEELQQGGFVWKARSNGNLGLVWKGGTE